MKKLIAIALLSFLAPGANAQAGVPDTLAYLNSIAANKSFFIGKPFSVLADSLKLQIRYYSPRAGLPHNMQRETSTSLSFANWSGSADDLYLTYPRLLVEWRTAMAVKASRKLAADLKDKWGPSALSYYTDCIIDNIIVVD